MATKGQVVHLALLLECHDVTQESSSVLVVRTQSSGKTGAVRLSSSDLWEIPSAPLPGATLSSALGAFHQQSECMLSTHDREDTSSSSSDLDIIRKDLESLGCIAPSLDDAVECLWQTILGASSSTAITSAAVPQQRIAGQQRRRWVLHREPPFGPRPSPLIAILAVATPGTSPSPSPAPPDPQEAATWRWLNLPDAQDLLTNPDADCPRVGPLAFQMLWSSPGEALPLARSPAPQGTPQDPLLAVGSQTQTQMPSWEGGGWGPNLRAGRVPMLEYPPGFFFVPMDSATLPPFKKTNLGIFAPSDSDDARWRTGELREGEAGWGGATCAVTADALLIDPGCCGSSALAQLDGLVSALGTQRLVIFVTHHHHDHVAALPVVRHRASGGAVLVGHPDTLACIPKSLKGDLPQVQVRGGEMLYVSGRPVTVVSAPGHTSGHLALFDELTRTLVVGDHCVGQGSAILDSNSGGDMQQYLDTTDEFLRLKPRVIFPMHGRPCFWPTEMLLGYKKHRLEREEKIFSAIQAGARSAYDVVSAAYADTTPALWPAALKNATLHVKRLSALRRLPQAFDEESFKRSSGIAFHVRCLPAISVLPLRKLTTAVATLMPNTKLWIAVLTCVAAGFALWIRGTS